MKKWILCIFLMLFAGCMVLPFSGCATKGPALVGGIQDLIELPAGTVIENVVIPNTSGQPQNIKTAKPGMWISLDGWNRVEQTKGT